MANNNARLVAKGGNTATTEASSGLRALLPDLGVQMASAAQWMLSRPEDVVSLSMRELARRAEVPPVTFVRLAQRLGLPSYSVLRQQVVEEFLGGGRERSGAATRNVDSARAIARDAKAAGPRGFAERFFVAEQKLLDLALSGLSDARLDKAATVLAKAPRVFVLARRTAFNVAFSFSYALRKARPHVTLLDDAGGAPEASLEDSEKGDVLFIVTFAPFSQVSNSLGEWAHARGLTLIVISDTDAAPIGKRAGDLLMIAPTVSHAFPESTSGPMAIANLLIALTVAKLGEKAQKRIQENERRLVAGGEYMLPRQRSRRRS